MNCVYTDFGGWLSCTGLEITIGVVGTLIVLLVCFLYALVKDILRRNKK